MLRQPNHIGNRDFRKRGKSVNRDVARGEMCIHEYRVGRGVNLSAALLPSSRSRNRYRCVGLSGEASK